MAHGDSDAALRIFIALADLWKVRTEERHKLLGVRRATYLRYVSDPCAATLSRSSVVRVSHLLRIYDRTNQIFSGAHDISSGTDISEELANKWVNRPNTAFGDRRPIDLMLTGRMEGIEAVRRYLDEAGGGWL